MEYVQSINDSQRTVSVLAKNAAKRSHSKLLKIRLVITNLFISSLLLCLINLFDLREQFVLMFAYSIFIAIIFGGLLFLEVKFFRGLNINMLLLVGYCLRLVIPSIEKSLNAINGIGSYNLAIENVTTDYMFPTVVWMSIYYMIFYACVLRFASNTYIEDSIKVFFVRFNITFWAIPIFIIGVAYNILLSFVPAGLVPSYVTMLLGNFARLAIAAQLFNTLFNYSKTNYAVFVTFILVAILQCMFFGFYKGDIMVNFLFYLGYYFLRRKYQGKAVITPKFIILCTFLFAFVFLFVYPFMQTKRVVSGWGPDSGYVAIYKYSNIEIIKDVIHGNIKYENDESGSRFDAVDANAFFYKECCQKGLRTSILAKSNIELLVPRFLKPNKHNAESGLMVTAYVLEGGFEQKELALSQNYVGQFASAYLIGGPLFVILLAFLNGWFISKYYRFLVKHSRNIIALIFMISFWLEAFYAFEEVTDAGALRTGLYLVTMIGIYLLDRVGLFRIKFSK